MFMGGIWEEFHRLEPLRIRFKTLVKPRKSL
nr:MAG TPA: hypothetical protein [Caudoviricetes sp.]